MIKGYNVKNRDFKTAFAKPLLNSYQDGTLKYSYKGVRFIMSPIDLALYLKMMWELQPATIIEIGSKEGGSALWLADMAKNYDLNCRVLSIDLEPPKLIQVAGITFLKGDVNKLDEVLTDSVLTELPHPWLVIEDSAHTFDGCTAALSFFAEKMHPKDVLIMEDGVLDELGLSEQYQGGPNLALSEFLKANDGVFSILDEYCDFFGSNATFNPNGYLRKN